VHAVENVILLPLTLVSAEGTSGSRAWYGALSQTLRRLAVNPLILAIGAGVAVSISGIVLPAPIAKSVALLASASSAVALLVIGGSLVDLHLQGRMREVGLVAFGKLILHPLVVLAFLLVFPVDEPLRTAAVAFAAMPMLSIYPILAQAHGEEAFCAAALLLTTLLSFVTISIWLWAATAGSNWAFH
jgi:malonate transporter and related proteins